MTTLLNHQAAQQLARFIGIKQEALIAATIHLELPGVVTVEAKYYLLPAEASPEAEQKAAELVEALRNPPKPATKPPTKPATKPATKKKTR
jgi:hypothetical protein